MLYLADRAGNVFTPLDVYQIPQLAGTVAKTPEAVVELLDAAIAEMQRRERLFDAEINHFPDKLGEYNRIPGIEPLARAVVIVDEVTVLVAETGGEKGPVHRALLTLAAQGRKYGFTLVVAGQDFKATTLNTALTHQFNTRVAFKAGSANESRVVLGVTEGKGAEALRGAGHGLLRHGGRVVEFQGFYVEKSALIARCAELGTPPDPGPQLEVWQAGLVRLALAHLEGAFSQAPLVELAQETGLVREDGRKVTQYSVSTLSNEWMEQGLLVEERRGDDLVAKRWVTPKLQAMVPR
jgi:DNA segregation ATPase FtsK/SpoIIIE-like protein